MKMKRNKDLILFVILIPLFLCGAFYASSRMNNQMPSYSVESKEETGYSVFYEALKEFKCPVERTLKPVKNYDNSNIQIVAQGGNFDVNGSEIKKWVSDGGTLIYLTKEDGLLTEYNSKPEANGSFNIYKYHKGSIVTLNADYLTNKILTKDTSKAYELLKEINNHNYKKIYFNESHLFTSVDKESLWEHVPMEIKYIIYQFIIVLVAFLYYKGKRFGKIMPLYDEEERSENEYLYSAAALYRQAKCWDIMAGNYYKSFLKQINYSSDDWLEYWKEEKLPQANKAKKVYEFMNNKKSNISVKEYIQIVNILEQLTNTLKKRRDLYWKDLKRPQ